MQRNPCLVAALAAVALCVSGCDWAQQKDAPQRKTDKELAAERKDAIRAACASGATYAGLKEFVFDEAARIRKADARNLDPVAADSVVRMEQPLVKRRDEDLNVTVCTGRFILELPPGVENAFDGLRRVSAEVEYSAQPAADGSGLVYQMDGAEPIIYRLATFGLGSAKPLPRLVTMPRPSAPPPAPPQIAEIEPRMPVPISAPAPRPKPAARPVERRPAGPARPSYNCRFARTTSEKLVCSSQDLAARDRAMSSVYYRSISNSDPATKARIRASRDAFLARRERCRGSDLCIARVYEERISEIRRIARE